MLISGSPVLVLLLEDLQGGESALQHFLVIVDLLQLPECGGGVVLGHLGRSLSFLEANRETMGKSGGWVALEVAFLKRRMPRHFYFLLHQ